MRAVFCSAFNEADPVAGLTMGSRPEPVAREGWTLVRVRAAALNGHDVWSLRGVGLTQRDLPRVLGSDGAGIDEDGREVIIYPVIPALGADRSRAIDPFGEPLLSERHDGTFAELVAVPRVNLVPMPAGWSFAQAACLPTAWLTAYRMLFVQSGVEPGGTVLVQGATGGVSTALIALGAATGYRMWVTGRTEAKRRTALRIGADAVFEPGARLPERVDAVMETVGTATWEHSTKSLKIGGTLVVAGATSGHLPPMDLRRLFFRQLRVVGSRMGTVEELTALVNLCRQRSIEPLIDSVRPLGEANTAVARLVAGEVVGKAVLEIG
ncbi:zinc-binding dehydrogenase [Prauserella muralis]|uniref:Zn-dependent oxidoreductase n=1 Tax=Prauserella muralis TaxID=588067 RepID=A0A2V4AG87_9PSEU|nr:zinc-binding dehydrogenase [Prauserella muralis]PXY18958.1 Zn-dependent oxidoreductase [Prauserella muralis]TWE28842.1 NADPH:quinone reductase-like Zn-dependent oxidoreductase [Prauserella muralis]